jgi:hypothetical protein
MNKFGAYVIIAIIGGLLYWAIKEAGKRSEQAREVVGEAMYHLPAYLRERTQMGPWFEMDHFFREMHLDVKCTNCEKDTIFVSNANPTHETECVDVHYQKGKLKIVRSQQVLCYITATTGCERTRK